MVWGRFLDQTEGSRYIFKIWHRCIFFSSFLFCRCCQGVWVCLVEEAFDSADAWWSFMVIPPCFLLLHCINMLLKPFVQCIFGSKFSSVWYFLQERELHLPKNNTELQPDKYNVSNVMADNTEYLDLRYRKARNFNVTQFLHRKSRVGKTNWLIHAFYFGVWSNLTFLWVFRTGYFVKFSIKMIM